MNLTESNRFFFTRIGMLYYTSLLCFALLFLDLWSGTVRNSHNGAYAVFRRSIRVNFRVLINSLWFKCTQKLIYFIQSKLELCNWHTYTCERKQQMQKPLMSMVILPALTCWTCITSGLPKAGNTRETMLRNIVSETVFRNKSFACERKCCATRLLRNNVSRNRTRPRNMLQWVRS